MKRFFLKHLIPLFLVTVMMLVFLPLTSALVTPAYAATDFSSGLLSYEYSASNSDAPTPSVSANGSTLTLSVKNRSYSAGIFGFGAHDASANTLTVIITANKTLSVDSFSKSITQSSDYGQLTGELTQGTFFKKGNTITITLTASPASAKDKTSHEVKATINFGVTALADVSITAKAVGTEYTVAGHTVGTTADIDFSAEVDSTVSLPTVTAPSGYSYHGWRVNGKLTTTGSFTVEGPSVIQPVILPDGVTLNDGNYKVGSTSYTYWEDAIGAAGTSGTVILLKDIELSNDMSSNGVPATGGAFVVPDGEGGAIFTIPNGVTLLVPYDADNTVRGIPTETKIDSKVPAGVVDYDNRSMSNSVFRTLTLPANSELTVEGKLNIGGMTHCMAKGLQGPHGVIQMGTNSHITVKSGATLFAWGYIKGNGTVSVESGGAIYEDFNVADYPGSAGNMNTLNQAGVFALKSYTIDNVQVDMALAYGARDFGFICIFGETIKYNTFVRTAIGPDSAAMLQLTSGTITKSYKNSRQNFLINGNAKINNLRISIEFLINYTVDSSQTSGLPIPSNWTITLESGTAETATNIMVLAGTQITVNNNAKFKIPSGTNVYVFDSTEDPSSVTADAKINVNGEIEVTGGFYTTESGADIISSNGRGIISYNASAGTASSVKIKTGNTTSASKTITPAKLHNGDGSYTASAGAAANTTFVYCETHNKWERSAPSTQVSYNANGGSGTMQVQTLDRSGTIAANSYTREGYDFSGWNTKADGTGEAYAAGDPAHFTIPTANVTLYAQWIPGKYTVTWKNEDGTVLETDSNVKAGTTPTYDGATPTKSGDAQYTYTFASWTPEISAVTGDVTYTATYTQTVNTYTVTWKMDDGTLIDTTAVEYGAVPTHTAPTKTGSNQIAYVFAGWKSDDMTEASTTLPPVTGPVTYYAVFTQVNKPYIQFETGAEQDIVSGSMDNQYVMPGESVYLRENQYTRTGYEFHHWIDANGTVYQDQEKIILTSTMASPLVLTAVWKQNDSVSDAQITVSWYDGFDGKLDEPIYYKAIDGSSVAAVEYYYHNASESLLYTSYDSENNVYRTLHQPTVPSYLGYYFKGWSIYVGDATDPITTTFSESADTNTISDQRLYENLSSLIKEDNSRVTFRIYAEYAKRNDTMSVNISYKLKDGTALTVSDGNKATAAAEATIGKNYRAVAKSEITEGNNTYYFDHWEYNGNKTSAAELVIRPSEVAAISLTAVYSTTAPQNNAIVELKVIDYFAERVNNVPKIAVTLSYNVLQSGYTIQKVGFYCGRTKESVQNTPSASCTAKTPTNVTSGTYTLHISSKTDITDPQTTFYARPYVIDNNGEYHYAPESEIVILNWSELAGDDEKEVKIS